MRVNPRKLKKLAAKRRQKNFGPHKREVRVYEKSSFEEIMRRMAAEKDLAKELPKNSGTDGFARWLGAAVITGLAIMAMLSIFATLMYGACR